jgi:outer membrane protein assembly factor BamB
VAWLILLFGGALTAALPAAASDWMRFRGPNGTGISGDREIPVQWSSDAMRWKVELPGLGNSSPVIAGDHLFVQCSTDDGKQRLLLDLDTRDGHTRWTRTAPGDRAKMHQRNTLASSTPATDGQIVCTLFWDGHSVALHTYDLAGTELWHSNLGPFVSQHGAGTSPVIHERKVFVAYDQDGASMLYAFDAPTGKRLWQAPRRPFRACYSTPFILDRPGGPELIVASTAGVTGYDPTTGAVHWDWEWKFSGMALRTVASPVYTDGLVIAPSGDGSGARHLTAVHVGDKSTPPRLAWAKEKSLMPYVPGMLAWNGHLYYVNDQGGAGCLVAATGESVWEQRLTGGTSASPVLIDGKVYTVDEKGVVTVFAASPTFQQLAKNDLGESVLATPAVADNRLYIRGRNHLFCIGKPATK